MNFHDDYWGALFNAHGDKNWCKMMILKDKIKGYLYHRFVNRLPNVK